MKTGHAAICLLSEHMTVIRQRIDTPVPRKRVGSASVHEKVGFLSSSILHICRGKLTEVRTHQAMEKFFSTVYAAILRHLPFQTLRAIVVASPGFTKDSVSSVFSIDTRKL